MLVTVLKPVFTTTYTGKAGDVLDLPQMEADRLIADGLAEARPETTEPARPARRRGGSSEESRG
jgi:hypothetical protein